MNRQGKYAGVRRWKTESVPAARSRELTTLSLTVPGPRYRQRVLCRLAPLTVPSDMLKFPVRLADVTVPEATAIPRRENSRGYSRRSCRPVRRMVDNSGSRYMTCGIFNHSGETRSSLPASTQCSREDFMHYYLAQDPGSCKLKTLWQGVRRDTFPRRPFRVSFNFV